MKKIAKIGLMLFSLLCVSCTLVGKVGGHIFKFKRLYIEGEGDIPEEAYNTKEYEKSTIEFTRDGGFIWGEINGITAVGIYNQREKTIQIAIQKFYRASEVVTEFYGDDCPQYYTTLEGKSFTINIGGAGSSGAGNQGYSSYQAYAVYTLKR